MATYVDTRPLIEEGINKYIEYVRSYEMEDGDETNIQEMAQDYSIDYINRMISIFIENEKDAPTIIRKALMRERRLVWEECYKVRELMELTKISSQ